jgi:hypothetical protein
MSTAGMRFISKALDRSDADAFKRCRLKPEHFGTHDEKAIVEYIEGYAQRNAGACPTPEEVAAEFEAFEYYPEVPAAFETMAREIKEDWAQRETVRLLRGKLDPQDSEEKVREVTVKKLFEEKQGLELVRGILAELEYIEQEADVQKRLGRTLRDMSSDGLAEYRRRKEGKSFKMWRTPFESLNKEIGGLYSGDVYTIFGESGRGKSYLTIAFVDEFLRQGATVLFKSYELKWFLVLARLISIATARDEAFTDVRTKRKIGISNKGILTGDLSLAEEELYEKMLREINDYYPGQLILQAKSDPELTRSLAELEQELRSNPDIDIVVVDPFNNVSDVYGRNVNKTAGGAAEQAARRFEQIIGQFDVVGLTTVQATVENTQKDKEKIRAGKRELKLPTRDQVKTTKAILEVSSNLFSFDNVDGMARVGVEKGRNGAEGFYVDLIAMLDYGVLREAPSGEAVRQQFTNVF